MKAKRDQELRERVLFTLLSTGALALAEVLASHLARTAWLRTTGREPPKRLGFFTALAERASRGAAAKILRPREA